MLQRSQAYSSELSTLVQFVDDLSSSEEKQALLALTKEGEQAWSYASLAHQVEFLARGLKQVGIGPGEAVALLAESRPETILACLAVIKTGAMIVPLDAQFGSRVLEFVLQDCGAGVLFTTAERFERVAQLKLDREIRPILLDAEPKDPRSWQAISTKSGGEFPSVSPSETAALFYTSGTTGAPKGVPLSHENLVFQLNTLRAADLVAEKERVLLPLPLHHVYPFVVGMLAPLALGLTLVLPQSLTGPQIIRALRQGQVTFVVGVPRLYSALYSGIESQLAARGVILGQLFKAIIRCLVGLQRRFSWNLGRGLLRPLHRQLAPQLRKMASGGAALNPELAWKLQGLGWQIAIGYGLTETSPLLTLNPLGTRKPDSVGKPIPGVEIRIDTSAAPGEGQRVPGNEKGSTYPVGEILARGPGVFAGYHHLPEKTQEAFVEGWFRTGDLGYFDEAGYLYLLGRVSTLLVTEGGENIQPEEVEESYQANPLIREMGVLQREGRLVAVIVPELSEIRRQGISDRDQAIRKALAQVSKQLPSYQHLSDYVLSRDPLPRTRLGKIRRHLLAQYFDKAREAGQAPEVKTAGPLPLEEMSDQDQALLENPASRRVWEWLAERYGHRHLTPETSPGLELGVDSLEWLNLSFEIRERTGIELGEEAIGRIETVRDLLQEVAEASEATTPATAPEAFLEHPEEALSESQRRWLRPLGPVGSQVSRILFGLNRLFMRSLFRLQVNGLEQVSGQSQFVIIPNHCSYLDPFLLAAALGSHRLHRTYWGGWAGAAFRTPFQRLGSRFAGAIPIDPEKGVLSSLALGAAVLKGQKNLVWFPEGGRSVDGKLQPFKPGIGLLLEHFSVPVVPVVIQGSHEALPVGKRLPRLRTSITISFSEPLDPRALAQEGEGDRAYQRITQALHDHIARRLGERLK
ncbi:AMP-dependent synthetase and ligase [Nitrosococcus halophilus Nc 4]|uniref:AMP-dependent synthetase and ligase n=1 Tax=Nitrosococcus halophilus (strain Nc4) TaxID=472759 RepID=D5BZB9_NITHN|nr:AMP-binding protein [Nitrosococcus halophilus]ADE16133.1 AMP-dependent synthetase and ligase [Nitrosococcus halophilus Nc 4]